MIRFLGKLPKRPVLAVSGGPDSMAIMDFFKRRDPHILYFNHGTIHGAKAQEFVTNQVHKHGFELTIATAARDRKPQESPEEYWRNMRLKFFEKISKELDQPIITCHHLDDQIETWLFTCMNGKPRLIPYKTPICLRPFLLTKKQELLDWCHRKDLEYIQDPSNRDTRFARGKLRAMMDNVLDINPGIHKVVKRLTQQSYEEHHDKHGNRKS